jgi:hypothetical protein
MARTWRYIVEATRNRWMMALFSVGVVAASIGLGDVAMTKTNKGESLEDELRRKSTIESRMLARAQKERLQVLFDELKEGKGAERYEAALDGQSLGCHSTGSTVGAKAIRS